MKQQQPTATGALVVAAGLSRRMGAFKPMLPLGSSTLIRTLLQSLLAAQASPILLVVGRNGQELADHVADLGPICLTNPDYATTDMFCSVCIGLRRIQGLCQRVLFTPGDSPCFSPASVEAMQRRMDQSGAQILIPAYQGRRGHPVLLDQAVLPHILSYAGPGGLRGALQAWPGRQEVLALDDPGLVLDADTPEDYQRLLDYDKQRSQTGPDR